MVRSYRVAVAGGTGRLGKHIVEALLESKQTAPFYIVVLSRSTSPDIVFAGSSAPVIAVDYNDQSAIEAVLKEHEIDTLISVLYGGTDVLDTIQQNLFRACLKVPTIHRFAPSEWGVDSERVAGTITIHRDRPKILEQLREIKENPGRAASGKFEFTKFVCGYFMNYLATGSPKEKEGLGYLAPIPLFFDLAKATANVPGDGGSKVYYTRAEDIGKFVAGALQLEEWPEQCDMMGDAKTFNEIVSIAEKVLGKKLNVTYVDEKSALAVLQNDSSPFMLKTLMEIYLSFMKGEVVQGSTLNELTSVKPMVIEEFVTKWWRQ
ncbi:NAD(P)-binding protein [Dendrothele bispora CBS 962.96]|uniref:NAD(P)-binding protein n=1 Tax=Dendrothele bispora (strain CBS 962.96) TaxID=1314807 RepID=A0A4V4HHB3_DENBC|nr:NAD(P)-binding protein [Dendrothele bispora CBS 962.96]